MFEVREEREEGVVVVGVVGVVVVEEEDSGPETALWDFVFEDVEDGSDGGRSLIDGGVLAEEEEAAEEDICCRRESRCLSAEG